MIHVEEINCVSSELQEKLNELVGDGRLVSCEYIHDWNWRVTWQD